MPVGHECAGISCGCSAHWTTLATSQIWGAEWSGSNAAAAAAAAGLCSVTATLQVEFPLDPPLSKMLIKAEQLKCTAEILTITAMISVPTVFFRPADRAEESDSVR